MTHRIAFGLLAAVCLQAQDFNWNTTSARSIALGGVYVPSNAGALDALAVNPAGLALLSAPSLDLSLTSVFARGSFSNAANRDVKLSGVSGMMPYGAFGSPIGGSRFSFGVGVVPDLSATSDWTYVDAPGTAGASYGLQRQKSAILAARTVGGVGVHLGRGLQIGATVGAVYNSNTLQTPYIFQSHPALRGLKTQLDLHTTGIGWNTSIGVLARPARNLRLGVAWKSRTVIESDGEATGTLSAQLAALGLTGFRPDYRYDARVRNVLPQSVTATVNWQVNTKWLLAFQSGWVNWKDAFVTLPVTLTNGNNADVNGLLKSTSIVDGIPLDWKDQFTFHGGFERLVGESVSLRGGFAHRNSPVPNSTLSPLTAVIMGDQLTAGAGYRLGRARFDIGYAFALTGKQNVGRSALAAGEYSNSRVHLGTQTLSINTSIQF